MSDIIAGDPAPTKPSARQSLIDYAAETRTVTADGLAPLLDAFRAEVERETRWQVADDFKRLGETRTTDISWGEAYDIARSGLCSCSGGVQPCPVGGESRG